MRFCTVSLALALRLLFYALTVVPLVEVAKTEWTVVFSMSLQGKKPAALVLCLRRFLGAMIIMRPGVFDVSADTLVVLPSAALTAAVFIVVKELSHTESSLAISAWMCVFVGAMSLPFAVNFWIWPTPTELLLLAAIGALATSAQYAAAEALRHSETNAMAGRAPETDLGDGYRLFHLQRDFEFVGSFRCAGNHLVEHCLDARKPPTAKAFQAAEPGGPFAQET